MDKGIAPPAYTPEEITPSQYGVNTTVPVQIQPTSIISLTPTPIVGQIPQLVVCPSCGSQITTRVSAEVSSKTHFFAILLCFVSCCCLPYLFDTCKDINHYCPNCSAYIGTYNSRI